MVLYCPHFYMYMGKKKVLLRPKSTLGYNDKMRICYNCMFRYTDNTGYCPWVDKQVDYNERGCKFFRYTFEIMDKYKNSHDWEAMTIYLKFL